MTAPGARGSCSSSSAIRHAKGSSLLERERWARQGHRGLEILFHRAGGQVEMASDPPHRPVLATGKPMNFVDVGQFSTWSAYKSEREAGTEGCCWREATSEGPEGLSG